MIHIALLLLLSAFANTPIQAMDCNKIPTRLSTIRSLEHSADQYSDIENNASFYAEPSLVDSYSDAKDDRARQYELKMHYHARDRERALAKKHLNNAEYGQSHIKKSNESESNHPQAIQASNDTRFQNNTPQTNLIGIPVYKQKDARKPQEATVDALCKILVVSGPYKTVDTFCEPREVRTKYRRMEFLIPHNGNSDIDYKKAAKHPYFGYVLFHVARSKLSPMRSLLPSNQIKSFMSQLAMKSYKQKNDNSVVVINPSKHRLIYASLCAQRGNSQTSSQPMNFASRLFVAGPLDTKPCSGWGLAFAQCYTSSSSN